MTTIALKRSKHGFDSLIVNGRIVVSTPRIDAIENVGAGRWKGTAGGYAFELFGGRAAGGTSRDWFVRWDAISKDRTFHVNSAAAAINLIQNA